MESPQRWLSSFWRRHRHEYCILHFRILAGAVLSVFLNLLSKLVTFPLIINYSLRTRTVFDNTVIRIRNRNIDRLLSKQQYTFELCRVSQCFPLHSFCLSPDPMQYYALHLFMSVYVSFNLECSSHFISITLDTFFVLERFLLESVYVHWRDKRQEITPSCRWPGRNPFFSFLSGFWAHTHMCSA